MATGSWTISAAVPINQLPSYTIVKAVTDVDGAGPGGSVDAAGDWISYQIVVTNTGNVTLTDVTLSDPLLAGTNGTLSGATESATTDTLLQVDETWTYTGTYEVQQADLDNNGGGDGDIDNTATADSNETGPSSDSEEQSIDYSPGIAIDKTITSVTDSNGKLVGVMSLGDVHKAIFQANIARTLSPL